MRGKVAAASFEGDVFVTRRETGVIIEFSAFKSFSSLVSSPWSAGKDHGDEDEGRDTETTFSYLR